MSLLFTKHSCMSTNEEDRMIECLNQLAQTIKKVEKNEAVEKDLLCLLKLYKGIIDLESDVEIPTDIVRYVDEGINPDQYGQLQAWHRIKSIDQTKSKKMAFLKAKEHLRNLKFTE
eukprot:NODE_33_length_32023_cov_0.217579.p23 type:complete len:116 gc:universal NODE_33_length_32023_cov_0.217579:7267-6920(-)